MGAKGKKYLLIIYKKKMLAKGLKRIKRKNRIRAKISWTSLRPRLAVFRSNTNIYLQLIDDTVWKTLCSSSDLKIKNTWTKTESWKKAADEMAKKILNLKIQEIVFDRWGFAYHGRVKAVADTLRENGLKF